MPITGIIPPVRIRMQATPQVFVNTRLSAMAAALLCRVCGGSESVVNYADVRPGRQKSNAGVPRKAAASLADAPTLLRGTVSHAFEVCCVVVAAVRPD